MILQLSPQVPLMTSKGPAQAAFLIDYGEEFDLLWVCFLDHSGECWTMPNAQVRAFPNMSIGRNFVPSEPYTSSGKGNGRKWNYSKPKRVKVKA